MSEEWNIDKCDNGDIVVTHTDGSGVLLQHNDEVSIAESLFYRFASDILDKKISPDMPDRIRG